MKDSTRKRKKAIRGMEVTCGRQEIIEQMYVLYAKGKEVSEKGAPEIQDCSGEKQL